MDRRSFLKGVAATGGITLAKTQQLAGGDVQRLPTRLLGKTGVRVTVLALGGYTGMKEPRTDQFDPVGLADAAIDAGVRYFDSILLMGMANRNSILARCWLAAATKCFSPPRQANERTMKRCGNLRAVCNDSAPTM